MLQLDTAFLDSSIEDKQKLHIATQHCNHLRNNSRSWRTC